MKRSSEPTPTRQSQDSASGLGNPEIWKEETWALNPCRSRKSRQCRYACENYIREPCREIMRRPKLQGFLVPEGHFHRHICSTVLTFAEGVG